MIGRRNSTPTTMRHSRRRAPWLAALLLPALGCGTPTEPAWEIDVGTLYDYPSLAVALTVPTTAKVGQPVTVTVTTAGSGNCTRAAGATVAIEGLIADIVPLDATPDPASGAGCWRDLSAYPRPVQLTFLVAGEARVRATGLRLTGDTGLVTTEATIQVEP